MDAPLELKPVLSRWPLTEVKVLRRFTTLPERQVFRVASREGDFVVKLVPSDPCGVEDRLRVVEAHSSAGFEHFPRIMRTNEGSLATDTVGGAAFVMEYVPKEVGANNAPSTWGSLGRAAARLNAITTTAPPFAIPIARALADLATRSEHVPFGRELRALLPRLASLSELPAAALVHGEINTANARRRQDGTVVFIDLDQLGSAPAALDAGYPLITQFVSEEDFRLGTACVSAFYGAYRAAGGACEADDVFNAGVFHALRYLWWGDTPRRWKRLGAALSNERELLHAIRKSDGSPTATSGG